MKEKEFNPWEASTPSKQSLSWTPERKAKQKQIMKEIRESGRAYKGKKNKNDKAVAAGSTTPTTSQGIQGVSPAATASQNIHEIDMSKEFENMAKNFKEEQGSKEELEKKYKYKCECGAYFNHPATVDGKQVCPDCGK